MGATRQSRKPRTLPDYVQNDLRLLFVGFNPGLRSARLGHYYAGRGNQFWAFLHEAGLIPERLTYYDDSRLLEFGIGLTDIVKRPTRGTDGLTEADFRDARGGLHKKIRRYRPYALAFVGKGVYEKFTGSKASLGPQRERIDGAGVFVLPSTSGVNTSLTRLEKLDYFRQLAHWVPADCHSEPSEESAFHTNAR